MDTKLKKKVIIGSIIGLILITGTILFLRNRAIRKIKKDLDKGSKDILDRSFESELSVMFPLKKGSGYNIKAENDCVKIVQRYLNMRILENQNMGYDVLEEDGRFGILTENACRRITGSMTVSYTFYKTMQNELINITNITNKFLPYNPKDDITSILNIKTR